MRNNDNDKEYTLGPILIVTALTLIIQILQVIIILK